jgi:hypothetical protein
MTDELHEKYLVEVLQGTLNHTHLDSSTGELVRAPLRYEDWIARNTRIAEFKNTIREKLRH